MKLLHLVAFAVACCAFSLLAFAQAAQTAPDQSSAPTPSTSQTKALPQIGLTRPGQWCLAPNPRSGFPFFEEPRVLIRNGACKQFDKGMYLPGSQADDGNFDNGIHTKRGQNPPGSFDKGIYLKRPSERPSGGTDMCASILSYNFSPGENPTLQSVTTCTPANPEAPLRTGRQKQPGPPALQLRKAVLESVPPQK
jgi:hypothetical protein